jgi:predicted PurR-regulated permease PerM
MNNLPNKNKLDITRLNEMIRLGRNILKVALVLFVIVGIYAIILIFKALEIFGFFLIFLKVLSPLFIGLFIAWLLDPFVSFLHKNGVNRILGAILAYMIMVTSIYIAFAALLPLFSDQASHFVLTVLPAILDSVTEWSNNVLSNFKGVTIIDIEMLKTDIISYVNGTISGLANDIPEMVKNFILTLFSTVGIFALGLIIGFYLLFDFPNMGKAFMSILPTGIRKDVHNLFSELNKSLLGYIKGTLFVSFMIFITSAIALSIIGLEAPLLLALIIGVADIIPYIGPYLGAFPAVIVAFTQGVPIGLITIFVLFLIQVVEGNFLQPLVMSKTMKLHPVSIIVGILIFGYFWGIFGMIIATPLVALIKIMLLFLDKKYNIFKMVKIARKET